MIFFICIWLFILFLFLEMFLLGTILFIGIGFGFLSIAILSLFFSPILPVFFLLWLIISLSSSFLIKAATKKGKFSRSEHDASDTNVSGMVGQCCTVIKKISAQHYIVLFRFEEWSAIPLNNELFNCGDEARIVRIIGNRIVIKRGENL